MTKTEVKAYLERLIAEYGPDATVEVARGENGRDIEVAFPGDRRIVVTVTPEEYVAAR